MKTEKMILPSETCVTKTLLELLLDLVTQKLNINF